MEFVKYSMSQMHLAAYDSHLAMENLHLEGNNLHLAENNPYIAADKFDLLYCLSQTSRNINESHIRKRVTKQTIPNSHNRFHLEVPLCVACIDKLYPDQQYISSSQ